MKRRHEKKAPERKANRREATRNPNVRQKSPFSSPRAKGRSERTLPGDRGAYEHETSSQGSE